LSYTAVLMLMLGISGCRKELDMAGPSMMADIKVSASIERSKVSLYKDGNSLKTSWDLSDRIIVFDEAGNTYGYLISDIIDGVGKLKLVGEGEPGCGNAVSAPEDGTTLYAVYCPGQTPADLESGVLTIDFSSQNGSAEQFAIMLAQVTFSGGDILFSFSNCVSILGIRDPVLAGLTEGSLEGVTISGKQICSEAQIRIMDGQVQFVPTCKGSINVTLPEPLAITDGHTPDSTEIFAAVPPFDEESDIIFSAGIDDKSTLFRHVKTDKYLSASKYYYTAPSFSRENGLGGRFSVSQTKTICFSAGNLWCDASRNPAVWGFEDEQYSVPYYNIHEGVLNVYDATHVRHFFWSGNHFGASEYYDGTAFPSDDDHVDWGEAYCESAQKHGWSTLSADEWTYLLSTRGCGDTFFKTGVIIADISGDFLVIAPDGNTEPIKAEYNILEWRAAEADGFVCLAPAGCRSESNYPDVPCMYYVGINGFYWTSDACSNIGDRLRARSISFGDSPFAFSLNGMYFRDQAFSIRLVCE